MFEKHITWYTKYINLIKTLLQYNISSVHYYNFSVFNLCFMIQQNTIKKNIK